MLTALMMTAALQTELRPDRAWMSGAWRICEPAREVSEVWTEPRLSLMLGVNVTLRDGRIGYEQSRIAPTAPGPDAPYAYFAQPEGLPVTIFPVVASGPGRVVFEQAADDDFPKRLVYERDGETLNARIEGVMGGQERIIRWRFHKAELNARCPAPTAG